MVILPYKDSLLLFSRYLQQLVMESLGKEFDLDGNRVCLILMCHKSKQVFVLCPASLGEFLIDGFCFGTVHTLSHFHLDLTCIPSDKS